MLGFVHNMESQLTVQKGGVDEDAMIEVTVFL